MSKNIIQPKKKVVPQTDNIEDLIIKKMESQAAVVTETEEDMDNPQRVNFMMPRYLYDMMKEKLKRKGDKMSNYLLGMVRKDLGDD